MLLESADYEVRLFSSADALVESSLTERDYVQVEARQQISQRFANPPIVIQDKDDVVSWLHS